MNLNSLALRRVQPLLDDPARYRIAVLRDESGVRLIDCGVHQAGGLEAGRLLAEICMASLGRVQLAPCHDDSHAGLNVLVTTDHPVMACLAAQYAGWPVAGDKFFGMGSGPMRAARGREELLENLQLRQQAQEAVGVLESDKLPPADVCAHLASECHVHEENLTLLVAPTSSIAGSVQVVARSIETALHKLHELSFDVSRIRAASGFAPLPPLAATDLAAIGRTNDSILYGGQVTLWVTGDDESLHAIGAHVPSSASKDYGEPFSVLFKRYDHDFYKMDPLLFSPAVVTFQNVQTGNSCRFGQLRPDVLRHSFN